MRVALPLFGSRVAPRCLTAREMVLAEIDGEAVRARPAVPCDARDEDDLVVRLLDLGVDLLVCGGIGRELETALRANDIGVVNNVAGEVDEVLEALRSGRLSPGWGLEPGGGGAVAAPRRRRRGRPAALPAVDCMACEERTCIRDGLCPAGNGVWARLRMSPEEARLFENGRDVSAETDPKLCRIAELVHFGLGLGFKRLGLAFCWELFEETSALARVLGRFFTVVPVCCRVGVRAKRPAARGADSPPCNPVAQAEVLAAARTDLNVLIGLCIGSDLVFTERSRAPVTTLFVKDRSLAHNPVGAIYTRYHLESLETGAGRVRSRGRKP